MTLRNVFLITCLGSLVLITAAAPADQSTHHDAGLTRWKVSDRDRPVPTVITRGTASTEAPGKPPSDAVVLFDGKDLSQWESKKGGPAKWKSVDGALVIAPGTGDTQTKQAFGDCQLHVEWAEPDPPHDKDQGRGNSGIYLMSRIDGTYRLHASPALRSTCGKNAALVTGPRPAGAFPQYLYPGVERVRSGP